MVRPMKWALAHASIPTSAAGSRSKKAKSCEREQRRRRTTRPARSMPTRWKSRLPMSKPTTAMSAMFPSFYLGPVGTMPTRSRVRSRRGRTIPLLLSPARRRACIEHVRATLKVPERRVCRVLGQHRSTQRKRPRGRNDEEQLTADIVELARRYGRYGYRKIAELLRSTAGWVVNDKRVERIWRREELKVPEKQPKRGRLWLADGSCVRLRAEHPNHVWSYDFVEDRTHDGRKYRMLNVLDEFTHESLAIRVAR